MDMNFQNLNSIEDHQFYLDMAFKRASEKVDKSRKKIRVRDDRINKSKQLEIMRIDVVKQTLLNSLNKIIDGYPRVDELDIFYQELIKCTLDYNKLKKSFGSIDWAAKQIEKLYKKYKDNIKRTQNINDVNKFRRQFYGRISSMMKQIGKYLNYLEEARRTMKAFPAVKTSLYTVCLFGFPNVGKTTLLTKITKSRPEINSYAFTTKRLNMGYITLPHRKIQIIDTPGTLNRPDKMNNIELQAYLALKHLADLVVYVFDPTLQYPLEDQIKLYNRIEKPKIVYLSKTDIEKNTSEFNKYEPIKDPKKIKELIIEKAGKKAGKLY